VTKNNEHLALNFPVDIFQQADITDELKSGFNLIPKEVFKGKSDYLFVYETENQIQNLTPNLASIAKLEARGVIATAKGENVDFVSRFFAPQCGVDEDPVTGSAHTTLTPFWSQRLHKNKLKAIQLSERKGYLTCELLEDRVEISGKAKLYLIGEIFLFDH
jgi:predicted PhzF superfamily epimerase YddE/YHI9